MIPSAASNAVAAKATIDIEDRSTFCDDSLFLAGACFLATVSAFTTDFSLLSALVALLSAVEATGVCVPLFVVAATAAVCVTTGATAIGVCVAVFTIDGAEIG